MSNEAMGYVFTHSPYSGDTRSVHLAIADTVNDMYENRLWMTVAALAEKCRCSTRTVQRALQRMTAEGYLELLQDGGGRGRPTEYRFLMPEKGDTVTPIVGERVTSSPERVTNTTSTPITNPRNPTREKLRNDPLLGFDHFWLAYPKRNNRKIGKTLCKKRWTAMTLDDRRAAYRGARNYATDVSAGKTIARDPDRWLRDRLWEDWQDGADEEERAEWQP